MVKNIDLDEIDDFQSDSESSIEIKPEKVVEPKQKKPQTDKQKAAFEKVRAIAHNNHKIRIQAREEKAAIEKEALDKRILLRAEQIKKRQGKKEKVLDLSEEEPEPEPVEVVYKKKPKKKIIVVESESEDDEPQIVYKKAITRKHFPAKYQPEMHMPPPQVVKRPMYV